MKEETDIKIMTKKTPEMIIESRVSKLEKEHEELKKRIEKLEFRLNRSEARDGPDSDI